LSKYKITSRQAFLIIVTVISTSGLQPSFRNYMRWAGNAAWLPLALSIGYGIAFVWLILVLAQRFPKQSVAEYAPKVAGSLLGYPLVLLLIAIFFLRGVLSLRNVSEFFVAAVLQETPISAIMLVMVILAACAHWADLEGLVRFNELANPIIISSFFLVLMGTLRINFWNLLPVFNKGFKGLLPVFQSACSDLSIISYILFLYPFLADPEKATRTGHRHMAMAGFLLLLIYLNTLLTLGSAIGETFTWPYLVVTENLRLLERGEALFIVVWTFAAFVRISFCFYIATLGLCQLFPKLRVQWVGVAMLPLATFLALQADNLPTAVKAFTLFNHTTLYVELLVPCILLVLSIVRKKGGSTDEKVSR